MRKAFFIAATLLAALALAACGGPSNAGQNVPPGQAVTTSAPAAGSTQASVAATATVPSSSVYGQSAPTSESTSEATTTGQAPESGTPGSEAENGYEPPNCTGNCTQPGPAITQNLAGDVASGQVIFHNNCAVCHGQEGKGGVANPGSDDGVVPSLNPVDDMFTKSDKTEFAKQLDLFIEHGSHTGGKTQMPNWGDSGTLTPQQIADVIAYILSLNTQ